MDAASQSSFELVVTARGLPDLALRAQRIALPGVSLPVVAAPAPTKAYSMPGDHLEYENLSAAIVLSPDLSEWFAVRRWIIGFADPDDPGRTDPAFADATLLLPDNYLGTAAVVRFKDVFPVRLGEVQFDVSAAGGEPKVVDVELAFSSYDVVTSPLDSG